MGVTGEEREDKERREQDRREGVQERVECIREEE